MTSSIASTSRLSSGGGYGSINHVVVHHDDDEPRVEEECSSFPSRSKRSMAVVTACIIGALMSVVGMMVRVQQRNAYNASRLDQKDDLGHVDMLGAVIRTPADTARWYTQYVDHLDESNKERFSHRYYVKEEYFQGPGVRTCVCFRVAIVQSGSNHCHVSLYVVMAASYHSHCWW